MIIFFGTPTALAGGGLSPHPTLGRVATVIAAGLCLPGRLGMHDDVAQRLLAIVKPFTWASFLLHASRCRPVGR